MCLPTLTYNEAWELSYFGANVLHPRTTLPAMRYKIPIAIRNFFNLDAPGVVVVLVEGWVRGCWSGWGCWREGSVYACVAHTHTPTQLFTTVPSSLPPRYLLTPCLTPISKHNTNRHPGA